MSLYFGTYCKDKDSFLFTLKLGEKFLDDEKICESRWQIKTRRVEDDPEYSLSDRNKTLERVDIKDFEDQLPLIYTNKYQKTGSNAVFNSSKCGPTYGGGHDLCIYDSPQECKCTTYHRGTKVD